MLIVLWHQHNITTSGSIITIANYYNSKNHNTMGNNNNGLLIYRPYSTCKSEKFINLIYKKM